MEKIFIVGCPRSGTTLLQQIFGSSRNLLTTAETHYFSKCYPITEWKRFISFPQFLYPPAYNYLKGVVRKNHKVSSVEVSFPYSERGIYNRFETFMERAVLENELSGWVEKTPRHLHFIDKIEKYIDNVRFYHIYRNPEDVINSLFDVTNKHSMKWASLNAGYSKEYCVYRWGLDIGLSYKHIGKKNHRFVKYEDIIESPLRVVNQISEIEDQQFSVDLGLSYKKVVGQDEPWKISNAGEVRKTNRHYSLDKKEILAMISQDSRDHLHALDVIKL